MLLILIQWRCREHCKKYDFNLRLFSLIFHNQNKGMLKVGRSSIADVLIPHTTISREQSRIYFYNGQWFITDGSESKQSLNGTW
jgi:hypothetical protein